MSLSLLPFLTSKHRSLHRRYVQLATAGEAEMHRYGKHSERDSSLEPLPEEDEGAYFVYTKYHFTWSGL